MTVLHEIRNHLAVAIGNVEGFRDGVLEPTPKRLDAVLRALGEVDALLDLGSGPPAQAAAVSATEVQAAATSAAKSAGPAVLVAEDNAELQTVLEHQFAELAVPLTIVSDGVEALAAVRSKSFALVFMDCQMPNLDGFAATRAIRNDERSTGAHLPIVAVTANAFKGDRAACLAAGMDDYIAKPVRIKDFRTMIERWTGAPRN